MKQDMTIKNDIKMLSISPGYKRLMEFGDECVQKEKDKVFDGHINAEERDKLIAKALAWKELLSKLRAKVANTIQT